MQIIKNWITKIVWKWCLDSIIAHTTIAFLNEGFRVENPRKMGALSLRFDLKVTKTKSCESYVKFYESSDDINDGETFYLTRLIELHGQEIHIVIVSPEQLCKNTRSQLQHSNITIRDDAPTIENIVMSVMGHHMMLP